MSAVDPPGPAHAPRRGRPDGRPYPALRRFAVACLFVVVGAARPAQGDAPPTPRDVSALLVPILERNDVPGMAAAIVDGYSLEAIGAAGVRRRGSPEKATTGDLWHLGSCTKSMTATLIGMLVEEKRLAWDSTVGGVFEELDGKMDPGWRGVTLEQLLTHRAGAPSDLSFGGLWARLWQQKGTPIEQRMQLVEGVVARPPDSPPGTKYEYANAGFAIAGAMAERVTKKGWEELIEERLFKPLGITSAGFGAPGTKGVVDQPRGHHAGGSPQEVGPGSDNPTAIGPAGTVHMSISDWAKYVSLHLEGDRGAARLLKAETFPRLHTPPKGAEPAYAMGWVVADRPWGGRVLTHNGSNTMWYCVTWISPSKGFAVLVCCNQGGPRGEKACDDAAGALIQDHQRAHPDGR